MRGLFVIFIVSVIALAILGPKRPSRAQEAYQAATASCQSSWKDSGYAWRVVKPFVDQDRVFSCQVRVNGGWFPESNVKVGK